MKKLISLLTISACAASMALESSARYRGDLNGDDRVDLADMVYLAKAIKAGSTDKALDVNASGKVDDYDLQKLADIIILGKLTEDSGMNVGIGGWEDSGEDFGGSVKAPAFTTRSADDTRFYMRNPKAEGDDRYSMEFGISEGDVTPAAILFNIRLPRELQFDASKIVELEPSVGSTHKNYGTPRFVKENDNDEWSDYVLRFIVMSPDLNALPITAGKLGSISYGVGDCWGEPYFSNCQVAVAGSGDCVDIPEHGGGYWGNFKPVEVTSVWFDQTEMNLIEGDEGWLYANIDPWDATDQNLVWNSSDESVVTVKSEDGRSATIKAVKEGEAIVSAISSNGISASCNVIVEKRFIEVQNIRLDTENLGMTEGDSATLKAIIDPEDATDKTITWNSSDENIAIVNANGTECIVTALAPGNVDINAVTSNGMTATCHIDVEARFIDVTEISLDQTSLEMTEGDIATLTATVTPSDATDKTLTWTSSDSSVASVSEDGVVEALKAGTATITVSTSNGKTATCVVTVAAKIIDVKSVSLDQTSLEMTEGDIATLTATVTPSDATDKTLTWTSSDSSVASVSENGVVEALKAGTATITVSTSNGKTATCVVTVAAKIIDVKSVSLDQTSLEMTEGDIVTLTATVTPSDATDKTLTWTSSDSSVALVSANGEVTALKAGTATITVSSTNGKTATCVVTVAAKIIDVKSVSLDQTSLEMTEGDIVTLTATVTPSDATDKTLTWTSSDSSVASVSENGVVEALKAGTATITVSSSNGKTATCVVTVAAKIIDVNSVSLDQTSLEMTEGDIATLTATVTPSDATDKTLTWTSSDVSVASVSSDGEVTALKAGTATITVSTSNGKTATCVVTVAKKIIEVTGIVLSNTELRMTEGDTATLTASVQPADATDKTLTWTSTDASVASVSANGEVTALKAGTATITVSSSNGKTATCVVTVAKKIIEVTGIVLSNKELKMTEGDTATLTASVQPADATDKTLTWTSSDASVASVSANGEVTALKAGTATITVSSSNGKTATCVVTVAKKIIEVTGIVLSNKELKMTEGDTATLTASVQPADATDKTLTWTSSDASVASVSANGEVKAVKEGSAVITVKASNGVSATCSVTVASGIVAVLSVTLDKTSLELTEGETATLTATVNPSDATYKELTWTSSDASVASVSANGVVKALKAGTATITVSSANGKTATCVVTVAKKIIEVTGIVLSNTELNMTEGDTATLTASVQPADATDQTITWNSSDENIAIVNANGTECTVTALNPGYVEISAIASNGITATCYINVEARFIEVIGISLSQTELSLIEGETATLSATVDPSDATDKTLTWTSSDSSVASVSENGVVEALKAGTATITVSTSNGKTATCVVTVAAKIIDVISVSLDQTSLEMTEGDIAKLTATVNPLDATDKTLTWTSSDSSVASVSENGVVEALKAGTATITVSTSNGKTASCEVTVMAKVIEMAAIVLDAEVLDLEVGDTHQFEVTVLPAETTYQELEWWIDDAGIANIDEKGFLSVVGEGSTIVHVRSVRWPDIEATCRLNAKSYVESIIDEGNPCDVYTPTGTLLKKSLHPSELKNLDHGIYIIRQGNRTTKLLN